MFEVTTFVRIKGKTATYQLAFCDAYNLFPWWLEDDLDPTICMEIDNAQEAIDYMVSVYTEGMPDGPAMMEQLLRIEYAPIDLLAMICE